MNDSQTTLLLALALLFFSFPAFAGGRCTELGGPNHDLCTQWVDNDVNLDCTKDSLGCAAGYSCPTCHVTADPSMKDLEDILQDYLTGNDPEVSAVYFTPAARLRMEADEVEKREKLQAKARQILDDLKARDKLNGK